MLVALCTCTADVIAMVRPATGTERHVLGVPRVFRLRALPPTYAGVELQAHRLPQPAVHPLRYSWTSAVS
jgi:hypothetical protein